MQPPTIGFSPCFNKTLISPIWSTKGQSRDDTFGDSIRWWEIFFDREHPRRRGKRLDAYDKFFRKKDEFVRKGAHIGSGWRWRWNHSPQVKDGPVYFDQRFRRSLRDGSINDEESSQSSPCRELEEAQLATYFRSSSRRSRRQHRSVDRARLCPSAGRQRVKRRRSWSTHRLSH